MKATVFSSYMQALQHLVGDDLHYFTTAEFIANDSTANSVAFVAEMAEDWAEGCNRDVADTLIEFAVPSGRVAGVAVAAGGEAHLGYILLHYTDSGDIVRFVTFQ